MYGLYFYTHYMVLYLYNKKQAKNKSKNKLFKEKSKLISVTKDLISKLK